MPAQPLVERVQSKIGGLPINPSSQQLVKESPPNSKYNLSSPNRRRWRGSRRAMTVGVLVFVNLINYMDRLTIAGIMEQITQAFGANKSMMGLLQTAFIISYMIFAPLFGYLGDRYSRKNIMAAGVFLWSLFTLIGSFMGGSVENRDKGWANPDFWAFLGCRAMVGIGEASYSTIAPTIISDMFVDDARSKALAVFYFAIPVGSGMGYMVSSHTATAFGSWQWGLRATPVLGILAVIGIMFLMEDPPRGESEGHGNMKARTYREDLVSLWRNKTFVISTLAFTCVTFCTGALSWWGPAFIEKALYTVPEEYRMIRVENVSFIFGAVTMASGIVGVPLGMFLSTKLKPQYPRADPVICGVGILVSAIFLTLGIINCRTNIILAFVLLFIGEVALNLNWSIVADMLLYVVVPTCRSTAEAGQILFSHAFGDAGSPYLIGVIMDGLQNFLDHSGSLCQSSEDMINSQVVNGTASAGFTSLNATAAQQVTSQPVGLGGNSEEYASCAEVEYFSMLYSLLTNSGVEIMGGILFFICAIFILKDKLLCEKECNGTSQVCGEVKMMLPKASPEESLGDEMPSDDESAPELTKDPRATTPV
jgi:MFS family permease